MIVGVNARSSETSDHLVGVHVRAGARAGLKHIDREMVVVLPVSDLPCCCDDRHRRLGREQAQLGVAAGTGRLDQSQRSDELPWQPKPADGEVVDGPLCLGAVEGIGGHSNFAEAVRRGSMERLAPILMTALAAGLALIPLALRGDEPGTEILTPMAIVILFGLLSSTLLNMLVVPALFVRFGRPARAATTAGNPISELATEGGER